MYSYIILSILFSNDITFFSVCFVKVHASYPYANADLIIII